MNSCMYVCICTCVYIPSALPSPPPASHAPAPPPPVYEQLLPRQLSSSWPPPPPPSGSDVYVWICMYMCASVCVCTRACVCVCVCVCLCLCMCGVFQRNTPHIHKQRNTPHMWCVSKKHTTHTQTATHVSLRELLLSFKRKCVCAHVFACWKICISRTANILCVHVHVHPLRNEAQNMMNLCFPPLPRILLFSFPCLFVPPSLCLLLALLPGFLPV